MGKDFPIPMLGREFAKPAGAVVDTKLEGVIRAGFTNRTQNRLGIFVRDFARPARE